MQCIQNDVIVNFNDIIRIVHCALNIKSTQTVTFLTFEWKFCIKIDIRVCQWFQSVEK